MYERISSEELTFVDIEEIHRLSKQAKELPENQEMEIHLGSYGGHASDEATLYVYIEEKIDNNNNKEKEG